jgi:hypothetical protein
MRYHLKLKTDKLFVITVNFPYSVYPESLRTPLTGRIPDTLAFPWKLFSVEAQTFQSNHGLNLNGHFKTTRVQFLRELSCCYHGNHSVQMYSFPQESHQPKPLLRMGSLIYSMFPRKTTRVLDLCCFTYFSVSV